MYVLNPFPACAFLEVIGSGEKLKHTPFLPLLSFQLSPIVYTYIICSSTLCFLISCPSFTEPVMHRYLLTFKCYEVSSESSPSLALFSLSFIFCFFSKFIFHLPFSLPLLWLLVSLPPETSSQASVSLCVNPNQSDNFPFPHRSWTAICFAP